MIEMDLAVDFVTANATPLVVMLCIVSIFTLAWNEYALLHPPSKTCKSAAQPPMLSVPGALSTTCGDTAGHGAGHGAGEDEEEEESVTADGVEDFLKDVPADVKKDMLKWRKMTFIRSRKQVCCEAFLQLFNTLVKVFDIVRKALLFVPPVGPPIKQAIDSILGMPILSDVLSFLKWLVLSSIIMSPAVFQIVGSDKDGNFVSVLYIFEMSGCYNRLFNNPQKRAKKLVAKTSNGQVVFEFAVKQNCCGMCPPFGQITTPDGDKVCHTTKPSNGCCSCCAPKEIGRVRISKKISDSKGNSPKPLAVLQSRFCPMACCSSIPYYREIKESENGKQNEVFFMLPNGFIEFGSSLCGEMPVPGLSALGDLPPCPAPTKYGGANVQPEGESQPEEENTGSAEGKMKLVKISNTHVSFADEDQAEIVRFCNRCQILTLMLFNDYMELGCKMNAST